MKAIKSLFLVLFTTSCLASNLSPKKVETSFTPAEISGVVSITDGSTISLDEIDAQPLLLIFAQETCEVCREETLGFKAAFDEATSKNLRIVTVLVGSIREDAVDWKSADNWEDGVEVPWSVGFEIQPQLFAQLCPNSGTPCSLLQLPGKGVILKHSGLLHAQEVFHLIESEKN